MSSKHIQTLQYYKDYADSTQILNQALNRQVKDCYQQIDTLRQQIRRLQTPKPLQPSSPSFLYNLDSDKVFQLQSQLRRLGQDLHDSKLQIMSLQAQLQGQQHANLMRQTTLQTKEDELMQLRSTVRDLQSKLFQSQRKRQALQLELDSHGTVASRYQQALDKQIARTAQSQSLTTQQQRQVSQLRYTVETQYIEIGELRESNTALTMTVDRLQQELSRLQDNTQWLQMRINEKGEGEETLAKQVESLNRERQEVQKRLRVVEGECEGLRAENRQLIQELNQKTTKNTQLQELSSKIQQMSAMIAQQKRNYQQKNSMVMNSADHSHLLSIVSQTSFASQQVIKLKDQNVQLNRDLQTKNALLIQFQQRVDRLNGQLDLLQQNRSQADIVAVDLHATQDQLRRVQGRLDRAEAELKEMSEVKIENIRLHNNSKELLDGKVENAKLQTTIKLLTVQNEQLRSRINKLEQQVLTLSQQTHSLTKPPTISQSQLMDLQSQYADTLLQNTLLLQQNSRLQLKRTQLLNDLEDVRMQLAYHADSYDQMKDLKHRLKDAYQQMDHLNRLIASREGEDVQKARKIRMRSPQYQGRVRNPEREEERGRVGKRRSPVQRMYKEPVLREHKQIKQSSSPNNWQYIQKKIQSLQNQNQQLRRNLLLHPAKRP